EELAAEVSRRDEAGPADVPAEWRERCTHPLGVAARRVEHAVDDEELVEPVLLEEAPHLCRDAHWAPRAHAAPLDDGIGAERALVVAAALRLQVRHAAARE